MSNRSQRMVVMAQQGQTVHKWEHELTNEVQVGLVPTYESTKGSNFFDKELAVRGWQQLERERHTQILKEALEREVIILKRNETIGNFIDNTNDKVTKNQREINSDSDSLSEDKSSGSEYIPSKEGSPELSSNTSKSSTDISEYDNLTSKKVNRGKYTHPEKKIDKNLITTHLKQQTNIIISQPSTSKFTPDSTQMSNADIENIFVNELTSSKFTPDTCEINDPDAVKNNIKCSNSKVKILSNVQLKPSTKSKGSISVKNVNVVTVAADSTTEICNSIRNIDNRVKISAAGKTDEGKRIRNKKHSCYYCQKMVLHIARHLEIKHENEQDVARALAFPKTSKKRKELFSEITRAGDFHYNCDVISLKQGELILVRRPTENEINFNKYRDYGPCPKCLGFLLKKNLWHHLKTKCSEKNLNDDYPEDKEQSNRQVIAESNAILSNVFGTEFSINYKINIVNTLRDDEVGNYCKEDNLILKFGAMLFEKYGTTQCELIRQNMRQLARLILIIRNMTPQNLTLVDLLTPTKFDLLVQGVKEICCKYQNDSTKRPEFMTPSLALKLGHSLKKCANIERGVALRQENLHRNESLMAFCNLMELEWQIRISSNALSTLRNRKINAGQLLPITNDLLKLNNYIKQKIEHIQMKLINSPTFEDWSHLAKLILCRIILFNKRRAGEASKMTLNQYLTRPMWSEQTNQELKDALTPYEMKLAERNVVVNIIGKRGRIVPVLLTPETKVGIDILNSYRSEVHELNPKNPYIFARGSQTMTHMKGTDVLRNIVKQVDELEKPDLITGTKLRKYVATVCQVFNLSENEYDWLARHLGHDIRVHREFYRLHEDIVELTKVSRLLMAVDTGEANKFSGKQLKDINLADLPPVEEELNNEDNDEQENSPEVQYNKNPSPENSERDSDIEVNIVKRSIRNKSQKKDTVKGTKINKRCPWNLEDKKAVLDYFNIHIKNGIVPGKVDCEECQTKYINLKCRKWTDIKFCVKNQITKRKQLTQTT